MLTSWRVIIVVALPVAVTGDEVIEPICLLTEFLGLDRHKGANPRFVRLVVWSQKIKWRAQPACCSYLENHKAYKPQICTFVLSKSKDYVNMHILKFLETSILRGFRSAE